MRDQDSWPPIVIGLDRFYNPLLLREDFWEKRLLAVAELEYQPAAGFQEIAGFARKPAVKIKPIRATIQGDARVVVAHLGFEGVNLSGGNVGRVGNNEVKSRVGGQGREAVAGEEFQPGFDEMACGVLTGEREGI